MSYRVVKNSPLEYRLNWIVEQMLENGIMELMDNYSKFLISIASISNKDQAKSNIVKPNNIDASNFFTMDNLMKVYCLYYLFLLLAVVIFIAEILYDRNNLIIRRMYKRIYRKCRLRFKVRHTVNKFALRLRNKTN